MGLVDAKKLGHSFVRMFFYSLILSVSCWMPRAFAQASYFYDPTGRLSAIVDPTNGTAIYTYDSVGNILNVTTQAASVLVVANVSPNTGSAGTTVTIAGTGYGTTANTSVSFNGVAATPSAVSPTSITVKVPSGATTGPISITSPAGTGATASNFVVSAPLLPKITSFSPTSVAAGGAITVKGSNFDPSSANDKVLINGMYAQTTSVSTTALSVTVPGSVSGHVTVETPLGNATTSSYLTVAPPNYALSSVASTVTTTLNGSKQSTVGTAGDVGLVLFDATAGQRAVIGVSTTTAGGQATIYGPSGAQLATLSVTAGSTTGALSLTQSGTYEIVYAPNVAASATFTIQQLALPASASITANGNPVSVSTTAAYQGIQLSFSGTAGQMVSLLVTESCSTQSPGLCTGDPSQILSITTPNATGVATAWCASSYDETCNGTAGSYTGSSETIWTGTFQLPTTGPYTITLTNSSANIGSATFTLNTVPQTVVPIQANASPVTVTTTVAGQSAVLTFSGTAGQYVSLQVNEPCPASSPGLCANSPAQSLTVTTPNGTGVTTAWCLSSYDQTCNGYSGGYTGTSQSYWTGAFQLPTSGTYTITLTSSSPDVGQAVFILSTVPQTAVPIQANASPVTVTTTAAGQSAILTFSGTAGQYVSLQVNEPCPTSSPGLCANSPAQTLTVTTPNGTGVTTAWCLSSYDQTCNGYSGGYTGTSQSYWTGAFQLPTSGTYTITLTSSSPDVGQAVFILSTVPQTAVPIQANASPVTVTTTAAGQSAILTFSGTAGQYVSLQVNEPCPASSPGLCANSPAQTLTVTTPNGTGVTTAWCLSSYDQTCNGYSGGYTGTSQSYWTGAFQLPTSGTYTITLTSSSPDVGQAVFILSTDPQTAVPIQANASPVSVTTTAAGQSAILTFSGTAGQTVSLLVNEACPTSGGVQTGLCAGNPAQTLTRISHTSLLSWLMSWG